MALPTADLKEFPMWILNPELRRRRFDGDPRCRRGIFSPLDRVLTLDDGHRPLQWGFAIIRTAYGPESDEQFQHALNLIGRIAEAWSDIEIDDYKNELAYVKENNIERLGNAYMDVDTRLNIEFTRRYQNDILQDKQLDGASVAMVRSYFNDWIASNNGTSVAGDEVIIRSKSDATTALASALTGNGTFQSFRPYTVDMDYRCCTNTSARVRLVCNMPPTAAFCRPFRNKVRDPPRWRVPGPPAFAEEQSGRTKFWALGHNCLRDSLQPTLRDAFSHVSEENVPKIVLRFEYGAQVGPQDCDIFRNASHRVQRQVVPYLYKIYLARTAWDYNRHFAFPRLVRMDNSPNEIIAAVAGNAIECVIQSLSA
ncbi:hypothetical protein HG530_006597 [Fusarium avenaceum]|nr:hypothetical protein HG530_006597 [Fusarium avenaceum]